MKRNLFKIFLAPMGLVVLSAALRAGDTAISDGQNAEYVLGQTDGGGALIYTEGDALNSQTLDGFKLSYDVALDTASHRLFVTDLGTNRVLVYNLDSNNVLVDRSADNVIGQTNYLKFFGSTAQNRLNDPGGLIYDSAAQYLYVADSSNDRVMIFDVASVTDGENAINVLGQSNFTSGSNATDQNRLSYPTGVVLDKATNRLFVSDTSSNRVMVFDVGSITDGENAINVLGQTDFTTATSGRAQNKLYGQYNIDFDPTTNRLFVADYGNDRIMVFDVAAVTDGENAINVLGQINFTASGAAVSQSRMNEPRDAAINPLTQQLFVSLLDQNRILVFDVTAITDGENAVNVLGQSDFTTSVAATTQAGLWSPRGIGIDPPTDRLFVADGTNNRVLFFNASTTTITNGQNASDVLGQTDGAGGGVYTTGGGYDNRADDGMLVPYGVVVDTTSHRLFVSEYEAHRVAVYDLDASNTLVDQSMDYVLGQPDFSRIGADNTQWNLNFPYGLALDGDSDRLFVSDNSNDRVLVFDVAQITNGENAVNVLGQSNFTGNTGATTQSRLMLPGEIAYEAETSRLFVTDRSNHRVMVFDVASITDGENAVSVLGQSDFTSNSAGTTQAKMSTPNGIALDLNNRLFVAETGNHRVLVFDVTSITDGENAINVLGQTDFTSSSSSTSQSKFNYPAGLAYNNALSRLFVSESTNDRVTVFDTLVITDGENAVNVLGQTSFTGSSNATAQNRMYYARGLSIDEGLNRLFVADAYNHRIIVHSVGPVAPSTSTLSATGGGDQIALSWNSTGDDGAFNNLTGNYRIQYATYTASWSTSTTPTNATTVTISTTNAVPGSAQSRIISGLTIGTTYYFVLWTADEVPNWSGVSNTTSAVPTAWFDPNQIEVDGANGGIKSGGQGWGDFDNDGDLDIVAAGYTGTTRELRIYSNNGNGTIDVTQIEVDGAGNGLDDGDVIWGDYDNDGDLDIAVMGNTGSNRQLRIYKNNGNATMNATQIEVDGANNGLSQGRLGWGDYDNDGDLDLLVNGRLDANATPYLRIYKNNGNGTINPTEIEVDPADGGLLGECAWGDFDNDGDLDILIGGGGTESRVYGNNGNGTFNPTQISVGNTGIGYPAVSWGDFDADGDLDVLSNGYHVSEGRNTFINKNNGNGTFNGTPLYVDGFNGGLASGRSAWGDFDNDGDLDILTSGVSSDWTSRQLRVYKNNGNGTFNETQFEIEGVNNGLESTVATWGDFDNDGDLDILASGTDDGTNQQLRIYKNLATPSNTTPSAPTTLAGGFTFNASGVSVASMTWNTGVDGGASPTPENVLTYDIQISTVSNFGNVIFPGQMGASPRMGSYLKPPKIFNSNTYYGVTLKSTDPWNTQTTASYGLRTDTTYYYRVKTVDAGQAESGWSNGASINTAVSPSTSTLVAASTTNDYEITVTWNSAGDDGMSGNLTGNYRIQYATFTASWSTSTTPSDVTTVTISTTNAVPGTSQSRTFSSLTPGVTYYFVLWTADESSNWSTISNTPSALSTTWFDPNQIEVDGAAGGGLKEGDVAWGDFDADGDLDILLNGTVDWPTYQLRVYKNNGNGTIDPVQIEVDGLNNGLGNGEVQWGDYDVDGDLDILVAGRTGSTGELRIYKNNGNGTISPTQIEVDGAGNGGYAGGTEWGDFDNDGDLDILISGFDTSNNRLRIYKNNGNGTIDPTEIDVDGATVGGSSRVRWGDFDGDGDLDFMTLGMTIYKNNGNGTMNATEYLFGGYVDSALNTGGLQWGDFDNDGDLDVLASGTTNDQGRLRVYKNNGNGTLNSSEVVVDGAAGGLYLGDVAWGDYDNDGDIEIVASGYSSGAAGPELRVYKNNGNATIDAAQQEVDGAGGGLNSGAVAAGDYDGDGDLDILVVGEAAGSKELRIYKNLISTSNTTPTAPNTLAMGWTYNPSGVSVASFTWAAGTDSGTGSTSENGLTYDIQISTVSNFGNVIFPGQMGASPRMGSYLKPPKIFNSNTYYGVVMKSTDPWNAQSTASYGLRTDTTYYYRVKTVDAGLAESGWSSNGSAYTGVVPSTSTLTAASTVTDGQILLTWNSAGDDGMNGNLTGNYRIQYATYTPTWSTSSTPTNATTVTISTTNMVPGSAQSRLITGLASATRYYFAIWTQDDVNNWSTISNAASADSTLDVINPSTSTVTLSTVPGNPQLTVTWNSAGDDGSTGNLTGNYRIQYATYTASWSTSTTPTNATTVTISTTNVVPGSAQNYLISSLATVTTYYLALWTQDEANNWSNVSNTTSAVTSAVDTTAPEASSLFALSGTALGQIQLSWASAGDDGSTGNLTGYYRIQYATYTATWSTSTTPTNAYTSTITATNVTPGVVQSTSIVVSPTTYQPWYFVIWTMDDSNNWSTISSAATGYPAQTQSFGIGPNALATPGLAQGGSAWGDFDNDGDLDVLASGTDGTNNQIRVYRSNGMGTFDSTAVNVSAANSGLKDGDVAWGDFDSDGDLDVLASGSDGSNRQLRVYKNNGNGTFNTSAVEVPGSANVGLSTGAVTCGDFDNDGDLDVLAGGYDGTNNQLRVYKNNGNATFDGTAINVAGSNNGLRAGGVAWGDYDNDADLDVLISGTDGTNRQLRVYANNGNGTFNATATNVAGSNNGLSEGRVAWGDFDNDADLDVLVIGTDGTNFQLRTYSNNGNGTFNATATNVGGTNGGVNNSAVAVGDYNVDGNVDVLAAGRPNGLVGYWKFDENTGTATADATGNGYGGTLTSGPTWTSGKYSYGVNFDGSDDYVSVSGLTQPTSAMSFVAWVKANSTPAAYDSVAGNSDSSWSAGSWGLYYESALLKFWIEHYGNNVAYKTFNDLNWHFVVGTWDGTTVRLYIDAVEGTSDSYSGTMTQRSAFRIGDTVGSANRNFPGIIDEVRMYNRALSAAEITALYTATRSSIGSMKIFKGNGNGTFISSAVELDGGLEKGQVAWGDAEGDGDLDLIVSGSDASSSLINVSLSTQSLTASNTNPSAPGTLSGSFSMDTGSVSVASFTWAAGSDSGTGSTTENGLTYDLQISTTSNFGVLMFPGQMGASPRMGSYLKPPKIFNSNTYYGVVLKSTDPWNAQSTASYGLRTDTTYYYRVKTVDAGLGESSWSSNGTMYSAAPPSTSTLAAASTATDGEVLLTWNSAGDDGMNGNVTGTYRIQYATFTASWSTSSTPTDATTVTIATTTQVPGSAQSKLITGLTGGLTYYFVLWTGDEVPNWSTISNSTSAVPALTVDIVSPSTSTLNAASGNPEEVVLTWSSAGDDGSTGNLTGNYRIQYATYSATWATGSTPTNATTVTIATTTQTPGSAQSKTITGLLSGTTYYFAIYTQDEANNWSSVSNTTSAVAGLWFDPNQIDVDGPGGGMDVGGVSWGDFDNDGDLDILASGQQTSGSSRELRVYKNNGNGTINATQIEVDGAGQGFINSGVAWGDFDNDGDLDILVSGLFSSTRELRVYKNNGNGTINANQIEVDGAGGGLHYGRVRWGDFDNDGDLDILANGTGSGSSGELRVYKNNGNGTIDANQIEVDGPGFGLFYGAASWGDFDNDGDLDILASGLFLTGARELRLYKNNGNGSIHTARIDVDGAGGGLWTSSVGWGDYDNDGDLDILASGQQTTGNTRELRIYKNNGNGTIDATQIEVDGSGNGLEYAGTGWGDFDNDGDIDIFVSGYTGSTRELRIYKNNGNATIDPMQIELDGSGSGLYYGAVAWGDYDNDGDLDVLASGQQTSGAFRELRVYKSNASLLNTNVNPSAPSVLAADWVHDATGVSTATFKWNPGVDNGTGATPENGLTYQLEVSTTSGFTGNSIVAGQWASPGMGNYHKPPKIFDGNTNYGVMLRNLPLMNTTYYYRVKTIDAGLKESAWSATESVYTLVASSEPSAVLDLVAGPGEGQILLTWTAPLNIQSGGSAYYDLRYSTVGAITDNTTYNNATQMTGEPTPGTPGTSERMVLSGLTPGWTYYFGIKSSNDNGTSVLDGSSPRPSYLANYFDMTQIDVDGAGNGPYFGGLGWGDFDNDGDLDILTNGTVTGGTRIQVHLNNGNGTFNATQLEIDGNSGGLYLGNVCWGDFDNDGDLDILASGSTSLSTRELRIYKNNGNGTIDASQIEVDGPGGGVYYSGVGWGDFDNDGDLDILTSGAQTSGNTRELRVYKNNGNGTIDASQIELDGPGGGLNYGGVGWGDFDNDGDLDILASGLQTSGSTRELRVYKNNGNGTIDASQIEVDGPGGGMYYGGVTWGDFDNDGDLDILTSGAQTSGNTRELRVYKNNGNGTIDASQIEVDGPGGGLFYGGVSWGDFDNDGDLDILASGQQTSGSTRELRVYKNNGNGTIDASQIEVDGPGGGLYYGGVGWADFDTDGDLDILSNGQSNGLSSELRIYKNIYASVQSNTTPTAPTTLTAGFTFDASGVSVASMTWNAGTDSGTGATPENVLTYDIQISTVSNFASVISPGQMGASPRMGSYLKPPKIFNSNTYYGVVLKSTDPWNAQTTASYGLRTDTTYYYRVKTVDSALAESGWSSNGSAYTGVVPSTSTLTSTAGAGQATIGWNSAGDDGMNGNLTGTYRIQYATYTASWSTSTTPTNATTLSISTTNVVPGSTQGRVISGLTGGLTYYFVLWTGDEVPNWSDISNTTSAYVATDFQWFDDVQIEVDGAGNGLKWGTVAWGDFDNDGDPDILVNGETGSTRELRIYKSNGNGTMDATQIEVDGAGNGLRYGSVSWGDFDNDGDLDIGALGWLGGTRQLRVYTNNGNGTINATQLEVDGGGGGMADGHFMWGDYDNDGDIDILAAGVPGGGNSELRIYKNNGNATTDRSQIEVDGVNGGVQLCGVAWGDYDTDGDLDILALGATAVGGREVRIYKNNGNGTMDPAQIEVDGSGNGLQDGGVAWGDFDSDGDMDIAAVGYTGSTRELRIYKNNGNGTMDPAQIEVDGSGNGLRYSTVAWGDFDVDGDLDLLTSGQQTSGTSRELRVYKNNGNATMDATQIEVDGAGNGLQEGGVAWGDFDVDGDLDILASGEQTSGTTRELRIYKNQSATSNTAPTAPGTLTGSWDYNATGISTATFKWVAGSDTGTGSTAANALTYAVEVSSVSGFTGKSVATGLWSSPGMGNYLKPPQIFDGNTTHGLMLRYLPQTNTTYYFRVKTVDAGLKESAWSATGSVYTLVASSAPSVVTDLAANAAVTDGQMSLTWTAPTNVNSAANAAYDVRYSTVGAITNDTEFNNATALTGEPTPGSAGMSQSMTVTGLVPLSTCYFAIKTSNDNGTSGVDVTSPRASAVAHAFDATQIEVETLNGGPGDGSAVWGDFENDGDLDILMSGTVSGSRELRIYKNNANGTISATQVEVDGAGNGLTYSRAIWGDYDNDGDLDILAMGYNGSTRELRIYKNNGNATMDAAQIEVDGSGNGLQEGSVAWGDYDNDGDLDILISGYTGSTRELRIYKNNGNATIDAAQIEVDGSGNGLRYSGVAWGDYDNDGDLDILTTGQQTTGTTKELRIYKNNGNATIDPAQIEVDGAGNGMEGSVAWGDYDNDGDLDILVVGYTGGSTRELRIYKNNANGTINATQIDVDGSNGGLNLGVAEWGDFDNDGDLDILTHGSNVGYSQLRVYQNNGNATIDAAQIEVDGLNGGLENGEAHWGDYDTDGDLDVLIAGSSNLRVYKNKHDLKQTNTTPTAPTTLAAGFTFDTSGMSVASMTWNTGTDSGTGATPENVLTYDIQISTVSNFASVIFPGQMGASPRMGSYLKPPKIFNSNTYYGVTMKSADPWNAQTTASYGLRTDTTYYYRVKTVDSALAESGWSSNGSAYTGVVPSTSTLAAASTATDGEVLLTWNSAGDDIMNGNVTGTYRIQYATYTPTWSTSSTPTNATTVSISTTNVVPGSAQSKLITGLTGGLTYYFVLWTGDEVPNWSTISNSTSAVPFVSIRSVTIEGLSTLGFGVVNLGSQVVASTGVVIRNDGTLMNRYSMRASTDTVGTPWSVLSSTPAGPDAMVIFGLFDDDTGPVLGNFDVDDVIGPTDNSSSSSIYSIDGSTTGTNVPAGQDRKLWIRMDMPTTSRTETPQSIRIRITAEPP